MRIISLYQPYASLCVIGAKKNETRSWDTNYRGLLGIHATKSFPAWCKDLNRTEQFRRALKAGNVYNDNLPFGAIIGTVELVKTVRTDVWLSDKLVEPGVIDGQYWDEYSFGDYSGGRYAWVFVNPIRFAAPIPAKGSQGFWNYNL